MKTCPRCGLNRTTKYGALSRVDNQTTICSECGTDEAIQNFSGEPLTPITEWAVNKTDDEKYYPFVFEDVDYLYGGGQILVSVFVGSNGTPKVSLARREDRHQLWSRPNNVEFL